MTETPHPSPATTTTDLDEHLMGAEPDYNRDPEPPPDESTADRYLRRYLAFQDMIAATDALADQRIDEVEAWREHQVAKITDRADWVARALEGWARARRDERTKSFSLPAGTIKTTKAGGRIKIVDPRAFVEWAKGADLGADLVHQTVMESPEMDAVQKWLKPRFEKRDVAPGGVPQAPEDIPEPETGEVIPGVVFEPPFISVSLKQKG
jgi:hypothetical protein